MTRSIYSFFICIIFLTAYSCKDNPKHTDDIAESPEQQLKQRYSKLVTYPLDSTAFPRSVNLKTNNLKKVPSKDWTSGFFAGNLWQIYELTGDTAYKNKAKKWTAFIEKEKFNDRTHDMGFKVFNSFGKGLKIEDDQEYKDNILMSAKTLITRYNDTVGSIRSWDFNKKRWKFPVIIDNMMNLELLFEATKISGDSIFHNIAVKHANTTLKNHFRPNNSTWHVLDYDPENGDIRMRVTHQGINDDSSWARGQAWGIYGFTMAYRYTKDQRYLDQAKATAAFFLDHPHLPEDGIPYWDFDAPNIPDEPRDVSAGAIVASALTELYAYTDNEYYLNYSKKVIHTIKSSDYILDKDIEYPFILDHSSGDWSKRSEMDEPIVYGDYYFLETLLRLKDLK
ncbi:glycoside hydrolase family 88 protein [Winogradskyella flava]|uniref:Glycoside hydrolase family 88 protein n=1 Tax=Winogradskyella flava TaxID=1884876 RepID=A0A842IRT7_9FLAO|nr:glycoside hydrolase family 88 protein [Winogradskyella flava]MBC2844147.1 glycoside hydrolase family 88 protein [Winogradskyella flava]